MENEIIQLNVVDDISCERCGKTVKAYEQRIVRNLWCGNLNHFCEDCCWEVSINLEHV